jgi:NAD(P)-dependent dehydrogenase (short-subunit alcohol dehydrogenase family)
MELVVVTGAARGIGAGIVHRLLQDEVRVLAIDMDESVQQSLNSSPTRGELITAVADVTDRSSIDTIAAEVRAEGVHLKGIVNNAGRTSTAALLEESPETFESVLHTNVTGAFHVMSAFLPWMLEQHSGSIVSISSVTALTGTFRRAAYSSSKAALLALTRSVATDYGAEGIRANSICPGAVDTDMLRHHLKNLPDDQRLAALDIVERRQLTPGLAEVDDVAAVAAFLLSDAAAFVNGAAWTVDGGWTAFNDLRPELR